MDGTVKSNIMRLLKDSICAIEEGDSFMLKELSNGNIHNASIFQDEDSLSISVVIYALSKVIEHTTKKREIVSRLQRALSSLSSGDEIAYSASIRQLIKDVEVEDSRLKKFVCSVIEQAQVKKGSAIHEHGISIGRVADMLGISKWALMQYLGKTNVSEQSHERIPTEKRLELARRVFS